MITIALIGGDGAGKSAVASLLRSNFPEPLKYLYMGINIESSNIALPTSRFIEKMKKGGNPSSNGNGQINSLHNRPQGKKKKNPLWRYVRLVNRVAEEWYRQFISINYRRKGFNVLYDRHFLFDFARDPQESDSEFKERELDDRLHRWLLHRFYPQPDLVLFLYAPAEVLFARKGEASIEYLDGIQKQYLGQGERTKNFVVIDATQPLEKVYEDVCGEINGFIRKKNDQQKVKA